MLFFGVRCHNTPVCDFCIKITTNDISLTYSFNNFSNWSLLIECLGRTIYWSYISFMSFNFNTNGSLEYAQSHFLIPHDFLSGLIMIALLPFAALTGFIAWYMYSIPSKTYIDTFSPLLLGLGGNVLLFSAKIL